jgi:disulfide oxidoreductase YuzD
VEFKDQREYIKTHKKIDATKFNKVSDITNIIDMMNNEKDKYLEDLIRDIAEENVRYGVIPVEQVEKELERRKKTHISNYLHKPLIKV